MLLECPQCRARVDVPDGQAPQCPHCGYGSGDRLPTPAPQFGGQVAGPYGAGVPAVIPLDGMAVAALVLGITSIVLFPFGFILAPLALIFGIVAHRRIRKSQGTRKGTGMATSGIVMGAIGTAIWLLVGILLAIGLFVADEAPDLDMRVQEVDDSLIVIDVEGGVDWSDFEIRADEDVRYEVNGDANRFSRALVPGEYQQLPRGDAHDGDTISLCGRDGPEERVRITLRHRSSNEVIDTFPFNTLAAC